MSSNNQQNIWETVPQKGFFGHPKGLFTLFFTEFWERFSYYGMRAILIFYLYYEVTRGGLGFDKATALSIMSIYGSLVYMSGVIGGWFADRVFGTQKAVFYGGILIMLGHIALAVPGSVPLFFVSMVLIILGTGLLKPNVSSIVGDIYAPDDRRRDSGFSIFYMGINLGAFIAPFIVGEVGMKVNFHLGFSIAAVGMFVGLVLFVFTRRKSLGKAGIYVPNPLSKDEKKLYSIWAIIITIALAIIIAVTGSLGILTFDGFVSFIAFLGILIPTVYFIVMYRSPKTTKVERSHLLAYIPLFIASVMFWSIQEQGATILATYADTRTNLNVGGFEISPAWFQSLNPLFIITLAPVFAWLWVKLGDKNPSIPKKFSMGILFAGLSFIVILIPGYFAGENSLVNPIWLVLSYLICVLGELCLSPVGLSATTKLAPKAFIAQTMSLWFLSNSAAQAINAQIVKFYTPETENIYFGTIGAMAIILAILLFVISPKIEKFMADIK